MKTKSAKEHAWIGWTPLCGLTPLTMLLRGHLPPWALMWLLAIVIFAGFKWWTWWRVIGTARRIPAARSIAYLFLWPGMNARRFFAQNPHLKTPPTGEWFRAIAKILFGVGLVWGVARFAGNGLCAGWIGMVGFIFLLHFGLFAALARFWQRQGIDAAPLMNCPVAANSLGDFWGRRWNSGFRDIVFGLMFTPLARFCGAPRAAVITFFISGLIHELVITFPAGTGYGLPTLYFTGQGLGLLAERSHFGSRLGLAGGWRGHVFALAVVVLPIAALFPPPFVLRVMVPFFQIIKALP